MHSGLSQFDGRRGHHRTDRGESRTDWARFDATTEAELETSIAADPDDVHEAPQWDQAVLGLPPRKEHINIRIDADVLEWFRQTGRGYQTRMNNDHPPDLAAPRWSR